MEPNDGFKNKQDDIDETATMSSNDKTVLSSTEMTELVAQASADDDSDNPSQDKPKKKSHAMAIGMVFLAILAIGGIGFGVWAMMDGNAKVAKKDEEIVDLKGQIADKEEYIEKINVETPDDEDVDEPTNGSLLVDDLYLVNDMSTKRHYYLAVTDLDQSKDSREIDTYLIDTTKLGTGEGISKYDIKSLLDRITNEKVAALPETLAEGTVNARLKSSCKSFRVRIGDVDDNPKNINWVVITNWDNLLPLTVYTECIVEDGDTIAQSLGTSMYAVNPKTGEYTKMVDEWF